MLAEEKVSSPIIGLASSVWLAGCGVHVSGPQAGVVEILVNSGVVVGGVGFCS